MYNTVSPIHVEGMPVTGGCAGVHRTSQIPLSTKKVPQIAVFEESKSEKLGILCIFGQRNCLKFRKGSSFVRLAPSEAKKKEKRNSRIFQKCPHSENQEEINFSKICTLPPGGGKALVFQTGYHPRKRTFKTHPKRVFSRY